MNKNQLSMFVFYFNVDVLIYIDRLISQEVAERLLMEEFQSRIISLIRKAMAIYIFKLCLTF